MDRAIPFRARRARGPRGRSRQGRKQRRWRAPSPLTVMLPVFVLFVLYHSAALDIRQFMPQPNVASSGTGSIDARFGFCGGGARINCVVDGDTFYYNGSKIRLADIDTPEVFSPRCAEEAALGAAATDRLHSLLNAGPFDLAAAGVRNRDRYGRELRVAVRDGRSLGAMLVSEGLARPWAGRRLPWCA